MDLQDKINELKATDIDDLKGNLNDIDTEERYNDMLDDVYGNVEVAGHEYCTSKLLEETDPIAYRCGMDDYLDNECQNEIMIEIDGYHYDFDEVKNYLDELEEDL